VILPFDERRVVVFHSLVGHPQLVEFEDSQQRAEFCENVAHGPVLSGIKELDAILELDDDEARTDARARGASYLRSLAGRISYLSLLTSEACNLGCTYCIAGENMRAATAKHGAMMKWNVAQRAVDWYVSTASQKAQLFINFSGGEPLINWNVVRQVLEYTKRTYPQHFERVRFTINTNATLVTHEIAGTLKEYQVEVGTSLDGTPDSSDLIRIGKATQRGVSDKILRGWKTLADVGYPVTGFMATFNDTNIVYLNKKVAEFAHEMGMKWLRVDCDVIHLLHYPIEKLTDQIREVYVRGKELGIAVEGFWSTAIHNLLSSTTEVTPCQFFCGAVSGETVSVHPDGRISTCGFSRAHVGNVVTGEFLSGGSLASLVKSYLPGDREFCKGCSIEGSCAGGCNIAREESRMSKDEQVMQFNCELYREMTRRLLVDHFRECAAGIRKARTSGPALHN
jgi:radical SAM protein with 4Fe4S-binding SPASM domain